ncbi:hypothetical protein T4E_3976 [Trichinella pseudospiralis]|uniref:Uncharacterized protein n=1 Tax=Trichinella pseudospiralis TaxID=6337 RepID=A0A0V0YNC7_TRIPS|nr:hypothetical protein T4E_9414 [Trichinella pseudospiralis]KRX86298.1 hypothetical protein T4E_9826 [Trichinella pseudospiralis]KRX86540.1 hypothetical protein T4E_8923 [Trichinella pseudospiralis]KRX86914.1 hypothetical protein T4E_608 [Trichinella pseudospiralis]KRY01681.1 hypothetical protein T4E_3976 [Trichinella pseudospiralis]
MCINEQLGKENQFTYEINVPYKNAFNNRIVKSMVHSNVVEQCIRSDLVERRPELGTSRITCRIW